MSLYSKLSQLEEDGRPIRAGIIGAGKFGSMFLSQVPKTTELHRVGIADLSPESAHVNLERVGWDADSYQATSLGDAYKNGTTYISDN
jgi:predicted homoserine dehydrogenase-like protein